MKLSKSSKCPCGNRARVKISGYPVCDRCLKIETAMNFQKDTVGHRPAGRYNFRPAAETYHLSFDTGMTPRR